MVRVLKGLEENTRLWCLNIANDVTMSSSLYEAGWLVGCLGSLPSDARKLLRNKARHAACAKVCITLIALRKRKAVLVSFPIDIVRNISIHLYDTRNQTKWDMN